VYGWRSNIGCSVWSQCDRPGSAYTRLVQWAYTSVGVGPLYP